MVRCDEAQVIRGLVQYGVMYSKYLARSCSKAGRKMMAAGRSILKSGSSFRTVDGKTDYCTGMDGQCSLQAVRTNGKLMELSSDRATGSD